MPKIIDWESRFNFIAAEMKAFRNERGMWPTLRELADWVGWNIGQTRYTLNRLAEAGLIVRPTKRSSGGARGYRPTGVEPEIDLETIRTALEAEDITGAVLAYIGAAPGCTVRQVARALGIKWGRANYHIQKLRVQGFLGGEPGKQGALTLAQPGADPNRLDWRQIWVHETLAFVRENPGCTVQDLVTATGLTKLGVRSRMRTLHRAGLVRVESRGRGSENHYFVIG